MKRLLAISSLAFFTGFLPATAKQTFNVRLSDVKVEMACIKDQGTVTAGKGEGGYGCNYTDGSTISCDKKSNCTYTIPQAHKAGTTNDVRANVPAGARNVGTSNTTNTVRPTSVLMSKPAAAIRPNLRP